jgi:hypothetical protein
VVLGVDEVYDHSMSHLKIMLHPNFFFKVPIILEVRKNIYIYIYIYKIENAHIFKTNLKEAQLLKIIL